jgi:hypothetical protein
MATTREQFIELLKQDIEQFATAVERIDELLPPTLSEVLVAMKMAPISGLDPANA